MSARRLVAGLCVFGLISGCSGLPRVRGRTPTGTPGTHGAGPPTPAPPARTVTDTLVGEAAAAEARGDLSKAASILERAIRVEPDAPLPWSRLAELRLRQERGGQAEQLARKSNRLAKQDPALQAHNWRLIAEARRLEGDADGARSAEDHARQLLRR